MEKKYIVRIPKIGTYIDGCIYPIYVDDVYQRLKIKEAKERWKNTINAPLSLECRTVSDEKWKEHGRQQPIELEYYYMPNPYYGWKKNQLKIIIEK